MSGEQVQDHLQPIAVCDEYESGLAIAEAETINFIREIFREADEADHTATFSEVFIYDHRRFSEKIIRDRAFRQQIINWLERNFNVNANEIRGLWQKGVHFYPNELNSLDSNPRVWETFDLNDVSQIHFVTTPREDSSNAALNNNLDLFVESFTRAVLNAEFNGEFVPDATEILEIISILDEHLFEVYEVQHIQS